VAEALEGYLLPAFGERELAGITATEIEDVYARWAAVPLAPSNIRRKDGMMRKIYADAVRLGELRPDGNPMLKVDRGGGTAPERMHIPTPEQLRRIVAVVERSSPMGAAFIELAAATGARRGSVLALRWQDVDLEACTLRVERGVSLGEDNKAHIKGTKSNRNYRIRLAGRVLDALRDLRRRAAETALALGEGARFDDLYLFSSDGGVNHWSVQHPSKVFRLAARELGLSWPVEGAEDGGGMHLHDLRHFAATRMLQAAVPVRVVAERLGCTEANVHRTYSHWIPSLEDERAAEVMAAAIG
jgi:integrase